MTLDQRRNTLSKPGISGILLGYGKALVQGQQRKGTSGRKQHQHHASHYEMANEPWNLAAPQCLIGSGQQ
ncbi:MAG: hypothetical protein WAW69_10165 [Polaromonas sp.]